MSWTHRTLSLTFACFLFLATNSLNWPAAPQQNSTSARVPLPPSDKPSSRPNTERKDFPLVPAFKDIAAEVGLTSSHISSVDKRYILESMSGGIGVFDCDNDGRLDIVMVNASTVERFRSGGDPLVTLWHQEPNGTFKDITAEAGLTRRGWGMGVAVADYDNDGWLDLYVTGFGGNALYHNLGNCKFEDVADKAGVRGGGFSTGAAWGDYDRDGKVDLFVSRYVRVDIEHLPQFGSNKFCRYKGILVQCGPWGLVGESDLLYHNRGWLDLFVANGHVYPQVDSAELRAKFRQPILLHRNNRDGTFDEVAKEAGLADLPLKSRRGAAFGDIFNTGNIDVVLLNVGEPPSLLKNMNQDGYHRVLFRLVGTKSNRAAIGARVTIHASGVMQFNEVRGGASYLSQNDLRLHFGGGARQR